MTQILKYLMVNFSELNVCFLFNFFSTPDGPNSEVCSSTTQGLANRNAAAAANGQIAGQVLNNAQIGDRMKSLFESSLKLHLTGQYMEVRMTIF